MKKQFNVRVFTLLPLLAALAGCAHVPYDSARPAEPDFTRAQHAASIRLARDGWPEARWWTRYHDAQLDVLIDQALHDSPTLAVAASRVAQARAALGVAGTEGGASVGLEVGANRQRYSGNGLFPEPIGGNFFNDASVQVKAGYDFDWWGKHRAMVSAALGDVNARRAEARQAEQTLAAAVAQTYFRLQVLWARIDNTQALAALQRAVVADRKARIARGLANIDEQNTAERDLGALNEQVAALAAQAGREKEALRALIDAGPEDLATLERRPVAPGVASLPSRLGIELLARRPDLQAARWRVEATLGRVAARQAAFYPDINLAGAFGLDAVSIGRLLRPDSRTMMIGSVIQLPLFDSKRLDADLGVARADRNAAIADYNQSVQRAVAEVAEEGATLQGLEKQAAAHAATHASAAALAASATKRMNQGLADRAALLLAQQGVLRQEDLRLQLQDAALQTEVALIKALGGGYRIEHTQ
ncbi:efflux transporter outer membrane subunit [Massilia sp. R2A-15]|uniref:efflux transporter outer membrane subunit n=1 Tax=Massilia sp. R2A-15 TaxID=3064278 RepID=UPI002732FD50|nr:efflux transporter outer membrane subunit [Massilia sp. R2A-15]WLI91350.1 efflux transporter outer membrane subunit [Massilia sp. R2A-15]